LYPDPEKSSNFTSQGFWKNNLKTKKVLSELSVSGDHQVTTSFQRLSSLRDVQDLGRCIKVLFFSEERFPRLGKLWICPVLLELPLFCMS